MRRHKYSNNPHCTLRDAADSKMHLWLGESSCGVSTPTLQNRPVTLDYEGLAVTLQLKTFN